MKKLLIILFICIYIHAGYSQSISECNNKFALNLLQRLADTSENCFYSPYSISTALFMTTGGARTQTEKEMLEVLCLKENTEAYHKKFSKHNEQVEKKEKIQLNIANSIWVQKTYKFEQSYINLLRDCYKTTLFTCDFILDANAETKRINKWVEDKTKNKIKNVLAPGILNPATVMVLVNAIYFYGGWKQEFKKEDTKQDDFYQLDNKKVKVDFMNAEYHMNYSEDKDFELLSIPYMNNEASMLVFLPKSKDNCKKALESVTYEKYETLLNQMVEHKVNLKLPKFKLETQFGLNKELSEMGMPSAFTDVADFSGMNGRRGIKIAQVIHKAFVDVSEKGTEAAAVTVVVMSDEAVSSEKEKLIYFKADHPFIFMIRDNATGQILFVGVFNKAEI